MTWAALIPYIPVALVTAVITVIGTLMVQAMKSRDSRHQVDREVDAQLETERKTFMLEMMEEAREQVRLTKEECRVMRDELSKEKERLFRLGLIETHLDHFSEGLDRLEEALSLLEITTACRNMDDLGVVKLEISEFQERVSDLPTATLKEAVNHARPKSENGSDNAS